MSVKNLRLYVALLVFVLGVARSSSADPVVIYSNFDPAPGYISSGWLSSEENAFYMGFQLTEAARLTSVTLPVAWFGNEPVEFAASVYSSSGGVPNFSTAGLIERMLIPFPADVPSGTTTMLAFSSSLQPLLSADTLYFIGANATRTTGFGFGTNWASNNAGIQGIVVNQSPGGRAITQGTLGAFQLTGELSPVPEPATMLMFATGAGLVLQRARRRRNSG